MRNIIGRALDELYRIFDLLNDEYYEGELPDPVLTIQKAPRSNNLGWFTTYKAWQSKIEENEELAKYEINLNPTNMNRTVEQVICTLHHEMVHYANCVSGIKDCNGQIHNKKFKTLAESVDLICEQSKTYGWGSTECSENLREFINEEIKPNESALEYFRPSTQATEKEKKPREKKTFKYACPSCDLVAKAGKDIHIQCLECECELEMEDAG